MGLGVEDSEFMVHYPGHDALKGVVDLVDVEIDDSIVLDGSYAFTGVRLHTTPELTEAEVFHYPDYSYDKDTDTDFLELYFLDIRGIGRILPFEVSGLKGAYHIETHEDVLKAVIRLAIVEKERRDGAISSSQLVF